MDAIKLKNQVLVDSKKNNCNTFKINCLELGFIFLLYPLIR